MTEATTTLTCADRVGLSDREFTANIREPINNLGGARLVAASEGKIQLKKGDDILNQEKVSFIKMDVEGLELDALRGLRTTIIRDRPKLFVEVENANIPGFRAMVDDMGYEIADSFRRYPFNENFLVIPRIP